MQVKKPLIIFLLFLTINSFIAGLIPVKALEDIKTLDSTAKVDATTASLTLTKYTDSILKLTPSKTLLETIDLQSYSSIKGMLNVSNNDLTLSIYKLPDGIEYEAKIESLTFLQKLEYTLTYQFETSGLQFYYQAPLDQELNVSEYDFVNATHAIIKDKVAKYRLENIVGSYAVYYEKNDSKVFHIYRPFAVDAKGVKFWCDLKIDVKTGLLTITIPKDYADKAIFPLIIDPTFGYTSQGASGLTTWNVPTTYAGKFSLTENGDITKISFYTTVYVECKGKVVIYSDNSGAPNTRLAVSSEFTLPTGSDQLIEISLSYSATSGTYWLGWAFNEGNGNLYCCYDSGDTNQYAYVNQYTPSPFGTPTGTNDYKLSIYATYTASSGQNLHFNLTGTLNATDTLTLLKNLWRSGTSSITFESSLTNIKFMNTYPSDTVTLTLTDSILKHLWKANSETASFESSDTTTKSINVYTSGSTTITEIYTSTKTLHLLEVSILDVQQIESAIQTIITIAYTLNDVISFASLGFILAISALIMAIIKKH